MIEALEFWNEPNNLSHWDYEADPQWSEFSRMVITGALRAREISPEVRRVLGGICPIDPHFVRLMGECGVLAEMDAVGIHGFPLDWDRWPIEEWPDRISEVEAVTNLPIWVTEVGCSNLDSDEQQIFAIRRTAELLRGRVARTYWYSLLDLPATWPATISPHETRSGSNYLRHYHMGLLQAYGAPKPAASRFDSTLGICQWFHWHDPRLPDAVAWLRRLGVRRLRTCISWADWYRPEKLAWFDRMMAMLDEFQLTVILCFTPPSRAVRGTITSQPCDYGEFAWFCEEVLRRYVLRERWAPAEEARVVPAGLTGGACIDSAASVADARVGGAGRTLCGSSCVAGMESAPTARIA
jgi:beta-xylosidase